MIFPQEPDLQDVNEHALERYCRSHSVFSNIVIVFVVS